MTFTDNVILSVNVWWVLMPFTQVVTTAMGWNGMTSDAATVTLVELSVGGITTPKTISAAGSVGVTTINHAQPVVTADISQEAFSVTT